MTGDRLDLTSEASSPRENDPDHRNRRFVGIRFACCGVYTRIYINPQQTAYEGKCPKCMRQVKLRIGPEGTDQRFFTAY